MSRESDSGLPPINWQMATSWPISLATIFGGAKTFADRVAAVTSGKFKITPAQHLQPEIY